VAGVVSGRALVTPALGSALPPITDPGQLRTAGPETTPAGQGNVRVVPPAAEPPSTP
jgi:hypothetical protein